MTVDIFTPESFSQAKPTPVDESVVADPKTRTAFNKLQKKLRRGVGQAISDYNMIEDGDKIMVCLSGGKDSYTMLDILLNLQMSAPIKFDIVAV